MNRQSIFRKVARPALLAAAALTAWPVLADNDDANHQR